MKKIYLSACMVVFTVLSFAQTTKKDSLTKKDSTKIIRKYLPANISVASALSNLLSSYEAPNNLLKLTPPNVASMEQYGNLPINYSTGQLNYSTPLYTINVGDNLNIPIQLLYNNTGLKPDQVPTWVGNGWDLSGFGSVVQFVKGIDDFSFSGLQNTSTRAELANYLGGMTDAAKYQYSNAVTSGEKDSQYDIFSFNMLGRNGKFYFNGTNVVFFNYMPLKVTFNDNIFTITDERGFVFRFALSINNAGSFSDGFIYGNGDPFIVSTKTWYLTKITTPSGADVVFNYTPDITYSIGSTNTSYSVGASVGGTGTCFQSNQFTGASQSSNMTVGQYLPTEILWKGKKVTFETILRDDLKDGNNNKAKALSKIKVYNESNTLIKQIGFDYGVAGYDRLQLENVSILDNSDDSKVQTFAFEYEGNARAIPIPFLGNNPANNAIDHWGYFNGRGGSSKIPRANYSLVVATTSTNFGNADRASDGDFSKIGMLKKVTYPTNGYTAITYEPNTVNFSSYANIPFFMRTQSALSYTDFFDSGIKDCNSSNLSGTFTVPQTIVAAKITWALETNSLDDISSFRLSNSNNPSDPYIIIQAAQTFTIGEMITDLPAGTYYYNLYPGCVSQAGNAIAQASFKIEQAIVPSGGVDLAVGGNRVSKIVDYDGLNAYSERNLTYENSNLLDIPFYVSTFEIGHGSGGTLNPCTSCGITYVVGENNVYAWDGFHVEYRKVNELMGINGANGKIIHNYDENYFIGGPLTNSPYPSAQNLSWRSGNLLKDETYQKESSIFKKLEDINKTYTTINIFPLTQNGVKIGRNLVCPSGTAEQSIFVNDYFNSALLPVFSDRFAISSETNNYYAGTNTLSSTQNYTYNSDWLLQKTSTTNSKNQTVDVLNYYANDFNNTIANTQITSLKNTHAIGIPLKIIKNVDNKTVEGVLINTDAVGNPTGIYRFENNGLITHTHNANTFFDSDFYLYESRKYSSKGNITEIIPRSGTPKSYVWGYKHSYPIAEIVNATNTQVETTLGTTLETVADYTQDSQISPIGTTLRTGLPNAFVTSGTMTSGIGFTIIKSPAGIQSLFDYDTFTRLKTIKDNNNFILKNYSYQYAGATTGGGCTTPAPIISAAPASSGCNAILTASACTGGTITWSNGQTGTIITVPSTVSPTYTATCTTTCTSLASNTLTALTYPSGWNADNVGANVNGCIVLGTGSVRMQANSSGGIGSPSNDFHYFYNKQFTGNVTMMAKLNSLTSFAGVRAGVIFKNGLGSKDVFFSIIQEGDPNSHVVGKLHRSTPNTNINIWQFQNGLPATGLWFKVKKVGNVVQSYYSTASNPSISNDTGWVEFLSNTFGTPPTMTWGTNFLVGLTLENPSPNSPVEVIFTNVQIDDNGNISNL
jgi:hypothetical protein